jgi:hypothetical protein
LSGPIGKTPKEAEEKTLLGEWRSVPKKCLTGPTLLEMSGTRFNQELRCLGFRLALLTGIWLMPTPMPPRTFGGYFSRAFSAAAFVLNGFDITSGTPSL